MEDYKKILQNSDWEEFYTTSNTLPCARSKKNMEMPRLPSSLTAHGLKYNPQPANKALENSSSLHTVVWKTLLPKPALK